MGAGGDIVHPAERNHALRGRQPHEALPADPQGEVQLLWRAVAQRVQPGQRLCGADSNGGSQRAVDGWPGPQAPLDRQYGRLFLHEEPTTLYISEPPETGILSLPQHQVGPVHALKPLNQIQQSPAGA